MQSIFWTGYYPGDRYTAIYEIQGVVARYGDIADVRFFSDVSLTLVIEVKEQHIDKLYAELSPIINPDKHEALHSASPKERTVNLNITFANGTGDLKVEVPSVPG